MKLKLDENGHVVVQDGKPVYVHDDGKEVASADLLAVAMGTGFCFSRVSFTSAGILTMIIHLCANRSPHSINT